LLAGARQTEEIGMKFQGLALVVALSLATGMAWASTGTVEARYAGSPAYQVGSITYPGANWGGVVTGVYSIDISGAGATGDGLMVAGQTIPTFCIDIFQEAPTGGYVPYTIGAVEDAPLNDELSPMGAGKANDLRRLFGLLMNGSGADQVDLSNPSQAAAFQAAVWEIVFERPTAGYDVTTGTLIIGGDPAWTGLANTYLHDLSGFAPENGLRALMSPEYQDFALYLPSVGDPPTAVPEPLTITSAFLGLSALGAYIRRNRKAPVISAA
jgi:hypothetical protein